MRRRAKRNLPDIRQRSSSLGHPGWRSALAVHLLSFCGAGPSTRRKTSLRRMAAFRDRESAVASNVAARTVPRFRPALPSRGIRDIGGFFGGSTTVCGRCSLRVAGLILFLGALAAGFGISAGGIRRVSGAYPSSSSPSPVKLTGSNHWEMLTFRSSIAAHPARPELADKVNKQAQPEHRPPIGTLRPCRGFPLGGIGM